MFRLRSFAILFLVTMMTFALLVSGGCAPSGDVEQSVEQQPGAEQQDEKPEEVAEEYNLVWGTMAAGSPWQVLGTAFLEDMKKNIPNVTGSILPTDATANLIGVQTGEFDI